MKRFFKVMALVFTALFIWAAVLQWNDPDAYLWYLIYGLPALVTFLFFLGKLPKSVPLVLSFLYLAGMVYVWPAKFEGFTIGQGDIVNIERGREAVGLLIIAVILMGIALRIRYEKQS